MSRNPLALIIEDDESLASIFSMAVGNAEFEIELVINGAAALQRLKEVVPSLIVLDLHLPNVSGKTILEYIRGDDRLAQTRVILATADAHTASSLEGQADLILIKPISYGQLRDLASRMRPPDTALNR